MLRNFTYLTTANIDAFEQAFTDEKFVVESSILLYLNYLGMALNNEENINKIRGLLQICIIKGITTKRIMSRFFINQEFSHIAMHICIDNEIKLDNNDFSKYYFHHPITNDEVLQFAIKCNISNINYIGQSQDIKQDESTISEQFETESILTLFPPLAKVNIDLSSDAIIVDGANWCRIENGTMDFTKLQEFTHFNNDVYIVFNEHHKKKLDKIQLTSNIHIIYSSKKVDDDLTCLYIALKNKVIYYSNDNHSNHYGPTGILHSKQIEIEQFKTKYNIKFEYNKMTKRIETKQSKKNIRKIHVVNGKIYVPINEDEWLTLNT